MSANNEINFDVLSRPFPKEQVKQRKGNWGEMLDYVEVAPVIARLNEAFDGHWSFRILWPQDLSFFLDPNNQKHLKEVSVLGELVAAGESKQQFGRSQVTRDSKTGEALSISDDLKAAASDSLKKTATMLSVALYLYTDGNGKDPKPGKPNSTRRKKKQHTPQPEMNSEKEGGKDNGAITEQQINAIFRIGEGKGIVKEVVEQKAMEEYGVAITALSFQQGAELIRRFNKELMAEARED